eukprot:6973287-Pyramimonas_sp.AAC.1
MHLYEQVSGAAPGSGEMSRHGLCQAQESRASTSRDSRPMRRTSHHILDRHVTFYGGMAERGTVGPPS